MPRRHWSMAAIMAFVLSFALSGQSIVAQEHGATGTVTMHLTTCNVTGTASSVDLQTAPTPSRVLRDCTAGAPGLEQILRIDGVGPDSFTDTEAVWNAVTIGDHTAIASGMVGEVTFTLGEDGIDLWAFVARRADPVPGTGAIIATLQTCDVAGTADSVSLAATRDLPPSLSNCRDGWSTNAGFLTINGMLPDTHDANVAVWYDMPYGDYTFSAGGVADDITVAHSDGNTEVWAYWDRHVTPGGSVRISVYACKAATGVQSWIGLDGQVPDGFSSCTPANIDSQEWGLRVDGERPGFYESNHATWLPLNGTHVATTASGAAFEFTVDADNMEFVAYFGPSGTVSGTVGGTVAPSLPNTGFGPAGSPNSVPALIIALGVLGLVTGYGAVRRTKRL